MDERQLKNQIHEMGKLRAKYAAVVQSAEWEEFRSYMEVKLREAISRGMNATGPAEAYRASVEQKVLYDIMKEFEWQVEALDQAISVARIEADETLRHELSQHHTNTRGPKPYHDPNDVAYAGRLGPTTGSR